MNLSLRRNQDIAELTIEMGNGRITEDLTELSKGKWKVPESTIEQFLTIANELCRFNGVSDMEFVQNVFHAFLNDTERQEFIEKLGVANDR